MQDVPLDVRRDNGVTLDLDWSEFEDTQPYSVPALVIALASADTEPIACITSPQSPHARSKHPSSK